MSVLKGQVFATVDLPTKTTGDLVAISLNEDGTVRTTASMINPAFPTAIGQQLMSASLPVTIASNQSFTSPSVFSGLLADGYANVQAGICYLYGFVVENQTGGTLYCQIHDRALTPANGTVPVLSIKLLANAQVVFNLGSQSMLPVTLAMTLGLTIASSSTGPALTLGAPNSLFVTALYKI